MCWSAEKQNAQQMAFVKPSMMRLLIYTLIGDAIATRGTAALRESGRERPPSCKRELLSTAVVQDKAESSQMPCMINDLWPRCVEAW